MLDNAMLKDVASKKLVTPAAKREAVADLRTLFEVSERRACKVLEADRTSVRYRGQRADDAIVRPPARTCGDPPPVRLPSSACADAPRGAGHEPRTAFQRPNTKRNEFSLVLIPKERSLVIVSGSM